MNMHNQTGLYNYDHNTLSNKKNHKNQKTQQFFSNKAQNNFFFSVKGLIFIK